MAHTSKHLQQHVRYSCRYTRYQSKSKTNTINSTLVQEQTYFFVCFFVKTTKKKKLISIGTKNQRGKKGVKGEFTLGFKGDSILGCSLKIKYNQSVLILLYDVWWTLTGTENNKKNIQWKETDWNTNSSPRTQKETTRYPALKRIQCVLYVKEIKTESQP